MPIKCAYKPNRRTARRFGERDAARIVCRVVRAGGSKARIDQLYRSICTEAPSRKSAAEEALEQAAQAIDTNSAELLSAYEAFQLVNLVLNTLLALGTVIPVLRPVRVAAQAGRTAINVRLASITAQRAANDVTARSLRQAAANEGRFRLTGTE